MFFKYSWAFNVLFGCGAMLRTGMEVRNKGCKKVLLVCDAGVVSIGLADRVKENLESAGVEVILYDKALPDPPDYSIDEGGEIARNEKVDGIIGLGGGSALDTAKAINVLINNPPPISKYFGGVKSKPGLPVFAIPTTAGTGCEQSGGAVVTNSTNHAKGPVSTGAPTLAIVDPELTFSLPKSLTLAGAMDALSHSIEVTSSIYPTHFTDILMRDNVRTIKQYLPLVLKDGNHVESREKIMFAASVAGSTFSIAYPHLGHAIGHSLGAKLRMNHGYAVISCLPKVLEYVALSVPDAVKKVGEDLGANYTGRESHQAIGKKASDALHEFKLATKTPSLKDLGFSLEEVLSVVPMVADDVMFMFSPRLASPEELHNIISSSYSY